LGQLLGEKYLSGDSAFERSPAHRLREEAINLSGGFILPLFVQFPIFIS